MLKGRSRDGKTNFAESAMFERRFAIDKCLWEFKLSMLTLICSEVMLIESDTE